MDKVVRDGKVAVLVSPGFGAGWSTWNPRHPECLFDPDIVAAVEREASVGEIESIAGSKWGDWFYPGGASDLEIEWVEQGTSFEIHEYHGSESLRERDSVEWTTA